MNAGTSYEKAKKQAQANANYTQSPRWLFSYNGAWWIDKEPPKEGGKPLAEGEQTWAGVSAEKIEPEPNVDS